MARCHSSMKLPKPQVRVARRSIIYFREGIESRNRGLVLQFLEQDHLREGRDRRNQMTSQPRQGAETWFQHPPILLRSRLRSALRGLMPKGPIVQGFVWLINDEPRSSPFKPTEIEPPTFAKGPPNTCQMLREVALQNLPHKS